MISCPKNFPAALFLALTAIPLSLFAAPSGPPPAIEIWTASETGISGAVTHGMTRLEFDSVLENSSIRSEIRAANGRRIWLYVESFESENPPAIEIEGKPFDGDYSAVSQTIEGIGRSAEGELIRLLAFQLSDRVPGPNLTALRRGLQTAYQAMQPGYTEQNRREHPGLRPDRQPEVFSKGGGSPSASHELPTLHSNDFLFSPEGGYVLKTQHQGVIFANNFLSDDHEKVRESIGKLPISPQDDPNIGEGCFGMCGKGCTNDWSCRGFKGWFHQWVTGPVTSVTAYCHCNQPIQLLDPDCSWVPTGSYRVLRYSTSGTAIHTIRGWSSHGCVSHDWCCRTMWFGCFNPLCQVPGVLAYAECAAGIGWDVSWSYVGPHGWQTTSVDQTECRWDCPECGSGYFVPPIEVDP